MHIMLLLLFLFLQTTLTAFSQVRNDDIEKRINLQTDSSPFQSNTTHCTVQWACVDTKAVTGCIKFHNDQWFEFTTGQAGRYYLSISDQQCRDVRGVQVLVLDGLACQPATYRNLVCHSTGAQDDIALILDSLQANHTYLINIDGYLNDFCQFTIAVSTQAPTFTLFAPSADIQATTQLTDSLVHLQWTLPDSLQEDFTGFYILKRHASEKRSQEITRFAVLANAYGTRQNSYTYTDTLPVKGMYTYKIIGFSNQQQHYLLKELNLYYDGRRNTQASKEDLLIVEIPVRRKLNLRFLVFDARTNELLKQGYIMTSAKHKNQLAIDISRFAAAGIRYYRVEVQEADNPQGYAKSFLITR
jgi:hypothetical protein